MLSLIGRLLKKTSTQNQNQTCKTINDPIYIKVNKVDSNTLISDKSVAYLKCEKKFHIIQ